MGTDSIGILQGENSCACISRFDMVMALRSREQRQSSKGSGISKSHLRPTTENVAFFGIANSVR